MTVKTEVIDSYSQDATLEIGYDDVRECTFYLNDNEIFTIDADEFRKVIKVLKTIIGEEE